MEDTTKNDFIQVISRSNDISQKGMLYLFFHASVIIISIYACY